MSSNQDFLLASPLGKLLTQGIAQLKLVIPADIQQKLLDFLQLLAKWNATYNLTAIREPREMVIKHLLDSLAIMPYLHGQTILDVGSGAGLPGIPLALACPDKIFQLIDSNGKKTRFMLHVKQQLAIANIEIQQSRIETFPATQSFDSILTRAFSTLDDMLEKTQHLAHADTQFIAMKGVLPDAELTKMPAQFKVVNIVPLQIPQLQEQRHLVIISKNGAAENSK